MHAHIRDCKVPYYIWCNHIALQSQYNICWQTVLVWYTSFSNRTSDILSSWWYGVSTVSASPLHWLPPTTLCDQYRNRPPNHLVDILNYMISGCPSHHWLNEMSKMVQVTCRKYTQELGQVLCGPTFKNETILWTTATMGCNDYHYTRDVHQL